MAKMDKLFAFGLFISIILNIGVDCSSNDKKSKLIYRKHQKPSLKNGPGCARFDENFHITTEKRLFMATTLQTSNDVPKLVNPDSSLSNSRLESFNTKIISSIQSVESIYFDLFVKQCLTDSSFDEFNTQLVELKWKFQFIESLHCIRVEMDFGNLTRFKSLFNYNYYMFSYRELGKKNIHLRRQLIADQINSLTLNKVHIRPYVVCVTFYKNNITFLDDVTKQPNGTMTITSNNNNNNNDTNTTTTTDSIENLLTCNEYKSLLLSDERMHDTDLCIDVDINAHFLSHSSTEGGETYAESNRELLMVLFIICLLAVILGLITLAHYLIEKPKKRRMLQAFRTYIQKKYNNHEHRPSTSFFSSQAILNSIMSSKNHNNSSSNNNVGGGGGPAITVTDFSSSNNTLNGANSPNSKYDDDLRDSEPLLSSSLTSNYSNRQMPMSVHTPINDLVQMNNHKVMFSIGETIVEEPIAESTKNDDTTNEESLKCVSHLLDDKPWLQMSTSQSAANFNNNIHRNSRSNSIIQPGSATNLLNLQTTSIGN